MSAVLELGPQPGDIEAEEFIGSRDEATPFDSESIEEFLERNPDPPVNIDASIVDVKQKGRERITDDGHGITNFRLTFEDGIYIGAQMIRPHSQTSDVLTMQTGAWLTSTKGHNEGLNLKLANEGIPTLYVGHMGEERKSWFREAFQVMTKPWETVYQLRQVTLMREAHNMLETFNALRDKTDTTPGIADIFGESNGSMTANWVMALAPYYGVELRHVVHIAKCFQEGMSIENVLEHSDQLPNEIKGLIGMIGKVSFGRLWHYPATINPSPRAQLFEAAMAPTLFNGDAGRATAHIHPDGYKQVYEQSFEGDLAGQASKWQESQEHLPNWLFRVVPGAHMSIMDTRTQKFIIASLKGQDERASRLS